MYATQLYSQKFDKVDVMFKHTIQGIYYKCIYITKKNISRFIRVIYNWICFFIYFSEKPTKHGQENNSMSNTMGSKPAVITTEGSQKSQQNSANSQQRREDIRLTKMMLIIFVSFIVSFYLILVH